MILGSFVEMCAHRHVSKRSIPRALFFLDDVLVCACDPLPPSRHVSHFLSGQITQLFCGNFTPHPSSPRPLPLSLLSVSSPLAFDTSPWPLTSSLTQGFNLLSTGIDQAHWVLISVPRLDSGGSTVWLSSTNPLPASLFAWDYTLHLIGVSDWIHQGKPPRSGEI